jgi:phosphoadenosine phosphosulfate reductase
MVHITEIPEKEIDRLEQSTPQEILQWACNKFRCLCIAASFGKDSIVLLHMLRDIRPELDVVYLNTGYDFPETVEFIRKMEREWKLRLIEFTPRISVEEQERTLGEDLYRTDPGRCCGIRKVEPMARALRNYDAWITGLRRDETEHRKDIRVVEVADELVKVNPLAAWTADDVWHYIRSNKVPYNPLYDKGYVSLGCRPCTLAGTWGRFERAGRWAGTSKAGGECGIHVASTMHEYGEAESDAEKRKEPER